MRRAPTACSAVAVAVVASWSCGPAPAAEPAPIPAYAAARTVCQVTDERLSEVSGMAVGSDRTYLANDGGTSLQVYVLDTECRVDEVLTAPVDPYDVEDLARAEDGTIWLADIGDNRSVRDTVALHALSADGTATLFRLTYPDGAHDAEALLLDRSGAPFILTKDVFGRSGIYTPVGPLRTEEPTRLRRVGSLDMRPTGTAGGPAGALGQLLVTGAALSPDGRLAVVRTYTDAYLYAVPDGNLAAALAGLPVRVALPPAAQGEAITFAANGRDLLLTSEGVPFDVTLLPAASAPAASEAAAPAPAGAGAAGSPGADPLLLPVVAVGLLGCGVGWGALAIRAHRRRAGEYVPESSRRTK